MALDGVWLDEVDRRIVISGVEPGDGKESISAVDAAAGYGQRVTGSRRSTLDIVVKFKLLQRSRSEGNMAERAQLLEAVNAWAASGGVLTVNYKPNRRLNVVLAQAPGEGSLDFGRVLGILDRWLPADAPVLLEHMETFDAYAAAYDHLAAAAARTGISI